MDNTTESQIRKLADRIARGEQPNAEREAEKAALAEEARVYQQLISRPGSGHGWQVVGNQPLHRIEALNAEVVRVVRQEADKLPLLSRIERYGEMDWWVARKPFDLTTAELDSTPIYREMYETLVAQGKAEPRPIVETQPDQEPSGGELYRIMMGLRAGSDTIPIKDPLYRVAGVLYTNIKDGMGAVRAIEHTFRDAPGTEAQTLTALEIYVPEVARLVLWLNARKAA